MEGIKEESVGNLFNLQVQLQENPIVEETVPDDGASPGAPDSPGPSAAVDTPETAGPASRSVTPAPGVPGPRPAGAHARGSTPARGQRGQRGSRAPGGAAADAAPGGAAAQGARPGGAHAKPAAGQPGGGQPAPGQQAAGLPAGLAPRRTQRLQYSAPSVDGGSHVETSRGPADGDDYARVGRNDPCPCGSGRKFKRCHGDPRMRPDG
jgi:hypothetical protein